MVNIHYFSLSNNPSERVIFLKAFIKIIQNENNTLSLRELGISSLLAENFYRLLARDYVDFFTVDGESIRKIAVINGYAVIGVTQLLEDLYTVDRLVPADLSKLDLANVDPAMVTRLVKSFSFSCKYWLLTKEFFLLWLFKYIQIDLLPHGETSTAIYMRQFDGQEKEFMNGIFPRDLVMQEIKKLPYRVKQGDISTKDSSTIISCIKKVCDYIDDSYHCRDGISLYMELMLLFNERTVMPEQHQGKKILLLTEAWQVLDRCIVVSKFDGKTVIFKGLSPLSRAIEGNKLVLAIITGQILELNVVEAQPLECIGPGEAKGLLDGGIACGPSREAIQGHIEVNCHD